MQTRFPSTLIIKYILAVFISVFFISPLSAQTAKRGDIKITEIMYNPPEGGTDSLEFIEFYNTTSADINLGGFTLAGVTLTIPKDISIPAKGRIVFSVDSAKHRRFFGNYSVKWKSGSLSNSGEVLGIKTPSGIWIDSLKYSSAAPWPKEPNGTGASLTLCNELADNKIATNWSTSTEAVGIANGKMVKATPGAACFDPNAGKDLTSPKLLGVQIQNTTNLVLIFNEALSETANLISNFNGLPAINSAVLTSKKDSIIISLAQPLQRGKFYKLLVKDLKDLAGNTITTTTKEIVINDFKNDLIITEIMYDNPGEDDYEFIELYNATTENIPLGGLMLAPSVSATLPNVTLAPGNYFVIAKDSAKFKNLYNISAWQWNDGELTNTGDSIFLYNTLNETIDSVIFSNSAPWTSFAAGTGSSLTLCNALTENKNPASWEASLTLAATDNAGNKHFSTPGSACNASLLPKQLPQTIRSICGNSLLDAENSGAKYKWSNGESSQAISADKPGIYSVLIVNGAGAITNSFNLTKLKVAAIFDTIVCMNEVVQFTDNTAGAIKSLWFFGDNDSAQSADTHYVFRTPGLVTVKLVVSDSFCNDTLIKQILVRNCTTGIDDFTAGNPGINIYPNPSQGEFNLQIKLSKPSQTEVVITDIQGKTVFSSNRENNKTEWLEKINLSGYRKGIYFLQLRSSTGINTEKLIIY